MNSTTTMTMAMASKLMRELMIYLWRTMAAMLIVAAAIISGIILPFLLGEYIAAVQIAGVAFGATTILAVLRELLQTIPASLDFIISGVTKQLPKLFAEVSIAALGLACIWVAVQSPPETPPERALHLTVGGSMPPIVMNESGAVFATYVTFGERKSSLEATDPQRALVGELVRSLNECVQSERDVIDLVVRAYASSSGPDADNDSLYRDRARYVESLLAEHIQLFAPDHAAQFKVEVRDWRSLEAMKLRRLFKDTNDQGVYMKNAAAFNRRADILVRSAGSCLPN